MSKPRKRVKLGKPGRAPDAGQSGDSTPESPLFRLILRVANTTDGVPELFAIARGVSELECRLKAAEREVANWRKWRDRVMPAQNELEDRHSRLSTAKPDWSKAEADERLYLDGMKLAAIARRNGESLYTVQQRRKRMLARRRSKEK